jgi:dynein light chain LC8-type
MAKSQSQIRTVGSISYVHEKKEEWEKRSQIEDMAATAETLGKVDVLYSEMNEADQSSLIEIATNALLSQERSEKTLYHKDVAQIVKTDLDAKGGCWHVIVGRSYGSFVTHETKTMCHFMVGPVAFLIWRHG